jgi:LacI family transcriptional regulator
MSTLKVLHNSKAVRLSRQILKDIESGHYHPGSMLPVQDILADRYGVTRATIRRAMSILTEEGKLQRQPQRGAVVPVAAGIADVQPAEGTIKKSLIGTNVGKKVGIAAIWAAMADYPAFKIFGGMKKYAEQHDLNFTNYLSGNHKEVLDILDRMENYPAEGVFVCPYYTKDYSEVLGRLVKKGFPIVAMRPMPGLTINTVMSNDALEAYQATHYLIEKYRRPVYYLCEPAEGELATDRHTGYNNAMTDAGFERQLEQFTCRMAVPDSDSQYWDARNKWLPGYQAGKVLLEKIESPASLYCVNDWAAKGIYEAAAERGLVIGRDLMVVGTDDLPFAGLLKPGLTSVRPDVERIGFESARLLHHLITGKAQPPIHIRLPVELVVRESA